MFEEFTQNQIEAMPRKTVFLCFQLFLLNSYSQRDSFYDYIELGEYDVGYCDTILFDDSLHYSQFNYKGDAPMFVQIWHPIAVSGEKDYLNYGDFRSPKVPQDLGQIYHELSLRLDSAFIRYNIIEESKTWKEIDYKKHSHEEILDSLKSQKTRSSRAILIQNSKFPVIVYHHGNQSPSDENYLMAEYFSSRGYIFISANFELPFKGHRFGFREGNLKKPNTTTPKRLIEYAKSLSASEHLFYIGHSYGAQVGFCMLYEEGLADAFVSMETTMEFRRPLKQVKSIWPVLYNTVLEHQKDYQLPILMLANTRAKIPFDFFNEMFSDFNHKATIQASAKGYFGHGSYTAIYFLRYLSRKIYKQPDSHRLNKELKMYVQNLKLIEAFLNQQLTQQKINLDQFRKYFFIEEKTTPNKR